MTHWLGLEGQVAAVTGAYFPAKTALVTGVSTGLPLPVVRSTVQVSSASSKVSAICSSVSSSEPWPPPRAR